MCGLSLQLFHTNKLHMKINARKIFKVHIMKLVRHLKNFVHSLKVSSIGITLKIIAVVVILYCAL